MILGENIHEEILKRSFIVFKHFALKRSLTTKIYDLLWKNCQEKHESIAIQIQQLICDILQFIDEKDKFYIFEKIKLDINNKIDENYLNFIKNFTINCVEKEFLNERDQENAYYGIPLFWQLLQENTKSRSVTEMDNICSSLCEILDLPVIDNPVKENYIEKCFDNIKKVIMQCYNHSIEYFHCPKYKGREEVIRKNGDRNDQIQKKYDFLKQA